MSSKKIQNRVANLERQLANKLTLQVKPAGTSGGKKKRKNRKRKRGCPAMGEGAIVIRRKECLGAVTANAKGVATGDFAIHPTNLPWAKSLANAFDMYVFRKFQVCWRGAVGTTEGGMVAIGADWSFGVDPAPSIELTWATGTPAEARARVLACTPNLDVPVWTSSSRVMGLPSDRLASRRYFYISASANENKACGDLIYCAIGPANKWLGEIWIDYELELIGTKPV
jgi:hypothetical protein